jgi:hypothetical protein
LTGDSEYAVVTVSERISADDVPRAIVHEIRELTKRTETGAFTPHEQGRMGELLHLAQEVEVEEYYSGHDPARRQLYQEKMRALVGELQLDQSRREHLDPAVRVAVEHVEAELAASGQTSPYGGPVRLSAEQMYRHIIPLHAYGSPATGTKFHADFDFDQLEQRAREVVERAPIPVKHDEESGNFAHEYDFGPGVVIGQSGTGRVRVWVDPDGNVRTVHPVDGTR